MKSQTVIVGDHPEWFTCGDRFLSVSCVNTDWKIFKMLKESEKDMLFLLEGVHSLVNVEGTGLAGYPGRLLKGRLLKGLFFL